MTLVLAVLVKNLNIVAEDKFLYGRKLEKLLKLLNWKKAKIEMCFNAYNDPNWQCEFD